MMFLGDDLGGEAMVGRRDANWACGNPTVTSSLLLSAVWAVEVVLLIRMLRVLGRSLDQWGVGNPTLLG